MPWVLLYRLPRRCGLRWIASFMVLAASGLRTYEWILASLAGILNLGLALAIASGVITASVRPKAGQAPVFEGKPTFRTTPTPKMNTASYESVEQQTKSAFARDATKDIVIASAVFVSIRRLGRVRPR